MAFGYCKAPFDADVKRHLDQIGSRKRCAMVFRGERVGEPLTLISMWDGGSKSQYLVYRNGEYFTPRALTSPFQDVRPTFQPESGDVLIEFGTFMGKPATPYITFYA